MNMMNMPGFSAGASLYKRHAGYRLLIARETEETIYPQLGPEPGVDKECFWQCYEHCMPPCVNTCLKTGG